jgi:hypothetical protein
MPRRGFESKVLRIFGYDAFYLLGVRLVALAALCEIARTLQRSLDGQTSGSAR